MFRLFEVGLTLIFSILLIPVWACHFLYAHAMGKAWLETYPIVGKGSKQVRLQVARPVGGILGRFFDRSLLRRSPLLWAVLKGDLSLVGPKALAEQEVAELSELQRSRLAVTPGLVHSYFLRSRANIAFESEAELALLDAANKGSKAKAGRLLRALPALLFASNSKNAVASKKLKMFGLNMENLTLNEAVELILELVGTNSKKRIAFVNPACVNIAMKDAHYRSVLGKGLIFPDGIGIQIASKYLSLQMKDNLNGTDLFPALAQRLEGSGIGIYLLGARPGVCEEMATRLAKEYPNLIVSGYHHGYIKPEEEENILAGINNSGAGILLVAMGVPGQELWIDRNYEKLEIPVAMGVGGLFDFMSGQMPRAPLWMREVGMEWAFRLYQEPRRMWRRYIVGNIVFLWYLMRYGSEQKRNWG